MIEMRGMPEHFQPLQAPCTDAGAYFLAIYAVFHCEQDPPTHNFVFEMSRREHLGCYRMVDESTFEIEFGTTQQ